MRLLHSTQMDITSFITDESIPPYAILSHTWGEEEVSLQDWTALPSATLHLKKGYSKIKRCCEQAQRDRLDWVWVDTCCIDKTSSAELSEAINSMFRWYRNAVVCYAILTDVPSCADLSTVELHMSKSRWFTRGWTLQELIAPSNLIFFSQDWNSLGTKSQIHGVLSSITGIEKKFLNGKNLDLASVAKKMSWAASRKTSRVEDIAYSLLGIFDINMPLLYGEGKKAFKRLQEEILKSRTDDHSLFAWGDVVSVPSIKITDISTHLAQDPVQPTARVTRQPLLGLLAESPQDFASSGGFIPMAWTGVFYRSRVDHASPPVATEGGIRLDLPVLDAFHSIYRWDEPMITQIRTAKTVALLCCDEKNRERFVKLTVQRWGYEYFGRTRELLIEDGGRDNSGYNLFNMKMMMTIAEERSLLLEMGDLIIRRHVFTNFNSCEGINITGLGDIVNDNAVLEARKLQGGRKFGYLYGMLDPSPRHGFAIVLSRAVNVGLLGDLLLAEFFPLIWDKESTENVRRDGPAGESDEFDDYGLQWSIPTSSFNDEPLHSHIMTTPVDIWNFDFKPFPPISVRAERMPTDSGQSFVDVVDFIISPKKDSEDRFFTPERRDR